MKLATRKYHVAPGDRYAKAEKLAGWCRRHSVSAADAALKTAPEWAAIAKEVGVFAPSPETVVCVIQALTPLAPLPASVIADPFEGLC